MNPDPTPELFVPFTIDRKSLFGIYECIAKNEHGKSKKSITIKEAFAPPVIDNVSDKGLQIVYMLHNYVLDTAFK